MKGAANTPVDNENQIDTTAPNAQTPEAPKHRRSEYIAQGFHNKTKGEFVFNNFVYVGIAYLGVMAVSIFSSWFLRDSSIAAPQFKKVVSGMQGFLQRTFKRERTAAELKSFNRTVDSNMTIAAFFTGGTIATVLPVKWLEDKKAAIVRALDTLIYGREKVDNDPELIAAHQLLDEAPKQTWLSVFASRLIAFGMTFGTSALVGPHDSPIGKLTGHSIDKDTAKFGRYMDARANKNNSNVLAQIKRAADASPNSINREGPNADRIKSRIWSYVGLDAIYTMITGATLFVFTRVLAPVFGKENNVKSEQPPASNPAPQAVSTHISGVELTRTQRMDAAPTQQITGAKAELHSRVHTAPSHELTA